MMVQAKMGNAIRSLCIATWHAVVVCFLVAPVCAAALYGVLAPALRHAPCRKIPRLAEAA